MHGIQTRDFPNCFLIQNSQAALTVNFVHLIDVLATQIAYILGHALANDIRVVEVSEVAEAEWVAAIVGSGVPTLGGPTFQQECTPGYYNNEGQPINTPQARQRAMYSGGAVGFIDVLEKWRADGDLAGLELTKEPQRGSV